LPEVSRQPKTSMLERWVPRVQDQLKSGAGHHSPQSHEKLQCERKENIGQWRPARGRAQAVDLLRLRHRAFVQHHRLLGARRHPYGSTPTFRGRYSGARRATHSATARRVMGRRGLPRQANESAPARDLYSDAPASRNRSKRCTTAIRGRRGMRCRSPA
jgi:hypothetical protein